MRRAGTSFVLLVCLTGCGGCALLEGVGPDATQRADTDAEGNCTLTAIPTSPSLAGLGGDERKALKAAVDRGIAVVRYEGDGCDVRFEVLGECRALGRYVYDGDAERGRTIARDRTELLQLLPLATAGDVSKNAIRVDWHRVGRWRAPPAMRLDRGALKGKGCDRATHVVAEVSVGGYAIQRGTAKSVDAASSAFAKDAKAKKIGDPSACAVAARKKRRSSKCDEPIAVDLVPLTNEELDTSPIEIAAKGDLAAFRIDRHEVTAAKYATCVSEKKCPAAKKGKRCTTGVLGKQNHPINCVTWMQAEAYCRWAGGRLPTEAEWTTAAKNPGQKFVWGNEWPPPSGAANLADRNAKAKTPFWETIDGYVDGFPETSPVGAFVEHSAPSGMTDAAGNVMEWTADWYTRRKRARVVRSSSFGHFQKDEIAFDYRNFYVPGTTSAHIGFRCVYDVAKK